MFQSIEKADLTVEAVDPEDVASDRFMPWIDESLTKKAGFAVWKRNPNCCPWVEQDAARVSCKNCSKCGAFWRENGGLVIPKHGLCTTAVVEEPENADQWWKVMPMAYSDDIGGEQMKEEPQSSCGPIVAARRAMEMDMPEVPLTPGARRAAEEFGGVYRRVSCVGEIRDAYTRGVRSVQKIMEVQRQNDPTKRAEELEPLLGYLAIGKDIVFHRAGTIAPYGEESATFPYPFDPMSRRSWWAWCRQSPQNTELNNYRKEMIWLCDVLVAW